MDGRELPFPVRAHRIRFSAMVRIVWFRRRQVFRGCCGAADLWQETAHLERMAQQGRKQGAIVPGDAGTFIGIQQQLPVGINGQGTQAGGADPDRIQTGKGRMLSRRSRGQDADFPQGQAAQPMLPGQALRRVQHGRAGRHHATGKKVPAPAAAYQQGLVGRADKERHSAMDKVLLQHGRLRHAADRPVVAVHHIQQKAAS